MNNEDIEDNNAKDSNVSGRSETVFSVLTVFASYTQGVFFHNKEVFFWCLDFKMIYYMCLYDKQEKPFVFNNVLIPSGTTGLPKAAYNDHSRFI